MTDFAKQGARTFSVPATLRLDFPLQEGFLKWGLVSAMIGGVLLQSPLAFLAIFVVFGVAGTVWRPGEPALAYALAYQWLFVSVGYFYYVAVGSFPENGIFGDIEFAVLLSLIGLVTLAFGFRIGISTSVQSFNDMRDRKPNWHSLYDLKRLFWITLAVGLSGWVIARSPMEIWFGGAQIIYRLLEFRSVFFFLFMLTVLRSQQGYLLASIVFVFFWIPSFSSQMSAFSGIFITLFVILMSEWRPWLNSNRARSRSRRVFRAAAMTCGLLLVLALIWTGGVKGMWRPRVLSGEVSGTSIDKAIAFGKTVAEASPNLSLQNAGYNLSRRLSSDIGYFANTVVRVPTIIPHENGNLTIRALKHVLCPRILFPEKENLGSDSWLVRTYAGVAAAGFESNTSIGLGYMAQFYIDFGVPGMFLALLAIGVMIGFLYDNLIRACPSNDLYRSVAFVFAGHFNTYGAELAKTTGALIQSYLVLFLLFHFFGRRLHDYLLNADPNLS